MKHNFTLKHLSMIVLVGGILISLGFWAWYQTRVTEFRLSLRLAPSAPAQDLIVTNQLPPEIELTVRGRYSALVRWTYATDTFELDLRPLSAGVHTLTLNGQRLGLPSHLTLEKVSPQELIVDLAPAMIKQLPIRTTLTGEPATGFILVDYTLTPSEIRLRGPQKILAGMTHATAKAVDINGAKKSFDHQAPLHLPEQVSIPENGSSLVDVHITIEPQIASRTITNLIVETKTDDGLRAFIDPPTLNLTINGPASQLETLDTQDIQTKMVLTDLKPGVYVRSANIQLPVGVTLIKAEPEIFTAHVVAERPETIQSVNEALKNKQE